MATGCSKLVCSGVFFSVTCFSLKNCEIGATGPRIQFQMFLGFAWNIYISLEAAVAPVFDMNLGLKISNCTMLMASTADDVSGPYCSAALLCAKTINNKMSHRERGRVVSGQVGFPPELCLLVGQLSQTTFVVYFHRHTEEREKKKLGFQWRSVLTLHVGCNLHLFFPGVGIDRWAGEKSHSITPPAVPISHPLLLRWCCCCCKLEDWINNEQSQ